MGLFSGIFSKKKEPLLEPLDFSKIGVDIHSHLIPGIDDGAKDMEDALDLVRRLNDLGYQKLITTPHIMSDFYRNTPEIINSGLSNLREAIKEEGLSVEIDAAAEYYLETELEEKLESKEGLLTFGKNYLLFELSFMEVPGNLNNTIFQMVTNGFQPVLAHVERYSFWHGDFDKYRELIDRGVLLQLNINSLLGVYGPGVQKAGEYLIDNEMISFLGTDCHRSAHIDLYLKAARLPYLHKLVDSGKLLNPSL